MKITRVVLGLLLAVSLFSSCKEEDEVDTCSDGIRNYTETGIDCGGTCDPCISTCDDGIQNGNETGIDCGGPCGDCNPTCSDGIQNGNETGIDCGGSCPPCNSNPTCTDGVQNGNETGIDCGGSCPPCVVAPSCSDGIQNGNETGVDCGGSCPPCPTCDDGIQNGNETGVDCGGSCPDCFVCGNTIQDLDQNTYNTVQIGNQCWTRDNLKTTRYSDGSVVPNVTDGQTFVGLTTDAWAYFNNDASYNDSYGKMYNWYAASDSRNLCPEGWHIPTVSEYNTLVDFLGGSDVAGGKMKETGLAHWQTPNGDATNSSGFTGRAGGTIWSTNQSPGGTFGNFWTQDAQGSGNGQYFYLIHLTGSTASSSNPGNRGYSCRCIKD